MSPREIASLRHRVAHGSHDARVRFDAATMLLAGRRVRGANPGRFLRSFNSSSVPSERWLVTVASELIALAHQIAPLMSLRMGRIYMIGSW
jgi:hypothetical protein